MTRTFKGLYSQISDLDNLWLAWRRARRGGKRKWASAASKLLLRMISRENTRDVAVLAYYAERPIFAFEARYERGKEVAFNAYGRFVVTEVPRFFKLRMDSDLSTPYGEPMQGTLIYLNQQPQPGLLVSTMRLPGASRGS